jgi:phosphoglycerol transferase MdoB-like AlkP superfamily enzyme
MPRSLKVILQRLVWLMFGYFVCRAFFLCWNWTTYSDLPRGDIAYAFFYGMRFDLSAILFTNSLLLLIWILPSRWLAKTSLCYIDLVLLFIFNWVWMGLSFVDAEFVKFIGKRTSYDLLTMGDDLERHSFNVIMTYWPFCLGLTVLTAFIVWMVPRFQEDPREKLKSVWPWAWRLAFIGLCVIGMRGGFQFKPLHPMHAYFSTKHELGLLTLNSAFNFIKSPPRLEIQHTRYFAEDKEAIIHLRDMTDLSRPPLGVAKGWNVVVLILESFSLEYMGASNDYPGYTPFLDELSKKAFFFPLNFANARRSIEGLPAVLCGLPAMMQEPVITSDFSNNRFDCIPRVLGKNGYSTYFLHGAHNGSMHFDTFSKIAGFENFVGLNEFPKDNKDDFDEVWGVLDEPMLQYAVKTIDEAPKPVMLSVFTLSSHHPYYIPPKYRGKFPKGTLEIHETIGYTDNAVREFFASAEKKPWFNHTIFVITADHTHKSEKKKYANLIGGWRVPLFIYVPGLKDGKVKTSAERITQQVDVAPSIYDLLGLEVPDHLLVGQSVFDIGKPGRAYNYTHYSYWYMDPEIMVDFGRDPAPTRFYKHKNTYDLQEIKPGEEPSLTAKALLDIKSVVHYMNEGLLKNSLHSWRKSL